MNKSIFDLNFLSSLVFYQCGVRVGSSESQNWIVLKKINITSKIAEAVYEQKLAQLCGTRGHIIARRLPFRSEDSRNRFVLKNVTPSPQVAVNIPPRQILTSDSERVKCGKVKVKHFENYEQLVLNLQFLRYLAEMVRFGELLREQNAAR